ncbi:MAG: hypothetical protein HQ556_14690 [Candidatus Marinimicrobia bacterium]|nr:hypothetical protein [Candidatus Neomarinimicrobiota bacterium]
MWYYTSLNLEYAGRVILPFGGACAEQSRSAQDRLAQQDTLFISLPAKPKQECVGWRLSKGKGKPTKMGAL